MSRSFLSGTHLVEPSRWGDIPQKNLTEPDLTDYAKQCDFLNQQWDSDEVQTIFQSIKKYYIPTIVIVGVVGNLLIGAVFFFTPLRKRTSSYLLLARAVVDTCFLLNLLIDYLLRYLSAANWLYVDCRAQNYVHNVSSSLSIWYTVGYTVERYIAVQYPTLLTSVRTPNRTRIAIAILTIAFAALNLYIFFAFNQTCNCNIFPKYKELLNYFLMVEVILCFFGPFFTILIMNILIVRQLFKLDPFSLEMEGSEESKTTLYLGRSSQRSLNGVNDASKCQPLTSASPEQLQLCTVIVNKHGRDQLNACKQHSLTLSGVHSLSANTTASLKGIDNIVNGDESQTTQCETSKTKESSKDVQLSNNNSSIGLCTAFLQEERKKEEEHDKFKGNRNKEAESKIEESRIQESVIKSKKVPLREAKNNLCEGEIGIRKLSDEISSGEDQESGILEQSLKATVPFNLIEGINPVHPCEDEGSPVFRNLNHLYFHNSNAKTFAQIQISPSSPTLSSLSEVATTSSATSTTLIKIRETEKVIDIEGPSFPYLGAPSNGPNPPREKTNNINPEAMTARIRSGCFFFLVDKLTKKGTNPSNRLPQEKSRCYRRYSSTTFMLVVTSSVFLILHLPSIALRSYFSVTALYIEPTKLLLSLMDIFDHIDFLHYSINFFLYCFSGSTFRDHTRILFMKWR